MFLYYKHHGMNFDSCKKQIFKSFSSTKMQPTTNKTIYDQFFLTTPPIWQVLTIPLLTEEALFTWAFFKYLQEFKVAYQQRHLE